MGAQGWVINQTGKAVEEEGHKREEGKTRALSGLERDEAE
jgi:hypothetical protein